MSKSHGIRATEKAAADTSAYAVTLNRNCGQKTICKAAPPPLPPLSPQQPNTPFYLARGYHPRQGPCQHIARSRLWGPPPPPPAISCESAGDGGEGGGGAVAVSQGLCRQVPRPPFGLDGDRPVIGLAGIPGCTLRAFLWAAPPCSRTTPKFSGSPQPEQNGTLDGKLTQNRPAQAAADPGEGARHLTHMAAAIRECPGCGVDSRPLASGCHQAATMPGVTSKSRREGGEGPASPSAHTSSARHSPQAFCGIRPVAGSRGPCNRRINSVP